MSETQEAVLGETRWLPEERMAGGVPELFVDVRCEEGELLDDSWAQEFDRRLAAWQADSPSATEASGR